MVGALDAFYEHAPSELNRQGAKAPKEKRQEEIDRLRRHEIATQETFLAF
jgi:hypothetical protein